MRLANVTRTSGDGQLFNDSLASYYRQQHIKNDDDDDNVDDVDDNDDMITMMMVMMMTMLITLH